jgi:hypothetical protein
MPYSPSVQHAKNSDTMVQCESCDKWRLVFSKKKLTQQQKQQVNLLLENISFSCGITYWNIVTCKRS